MHYSKQRELIMDTLLEMTRSDASHPTADALYAAVRRQSPAISLATVYRNLTQLTEAGQVLRIPVPGSADRFDPASSDHLHMLCTVCGGVCDIPCSAVPDVCTQVSERTGAQVSECVMFFYGVCPDCRQ